MAIRRADCDENCKMFDLKATAMAEPEELDKLRRIQRIHDCVEKVLATRPEQHDSFILDG